MKRIVPTVSPDPRRARRDAVALSELLPFWFAISSPLIGVMVGLLGAWFVTWLTSY